jgi:hypothetical protein
MPNNQHLVVIGEMIVEATDVALTAENIVRMHQTPEGAEILRLIVRDDLGGAGSIIAAALWHNDWTVV